jgi:hypothetical protein
VAQLGSASALGAEGRGFKSRHPDHLRDHVGASPLIVFWAVQRLRLLCKLRARVSVPGLLGPRPPPGGESPDLSGSGENQEVSHKETEP